MLRFHLHTWAEVRELAAILGDAARGMGAAVYYWACGDEEPGAEL